EAVAQREIVVPRRRVELMRDITRLVPILETHGGTDRACAEAIEEIAVQVRRDDVLLVGEVFRQRAEHIREGLGVHVLAAEEIERHAARGAGIEAGPRKRRATHDVARGRVSYGIEGPGEEV